MKLLLVIDIADDVAEVYEKLTVDYDLRGTPKEDGFYTESIKYVEDAKIRPLPQKKSHKEYSWNAEKIETINDYENGWNDCIGAITGETE